MTGFELNACRHRAAVKGRAKIEKAHKERSGLRLLDGLRLVQGDVRSHHLGRATHIFMSVQCWGPELISTIVASLVPMAPNMRCMIFSATGAKSILNASPNATVEQLEADFAARRPETVPRRRRRQRRQWRLTAGTSPS